MAENTSKNSEVTFEFFLLSYHKIIEQLELELNISNEQDTFDHNLTMDLDYIWMSALKILQLFEDTIQSFYPSNSQL